MHFDRGLIFVVSTAVAACQTVVCGEQTLESRSVLLRIIESVDIPALTSGGLATIDVREGSMVEEGELIAKVDSRRARLAAKQTKAELKIAQKKAEDDIDIRFAKKSHEIAVAELKRSESINDEIPGVVTAREIDRLTLAVERTSLEIERAFNNRENAKLELQQKETDLLLAEHAVDAHQIESPFPGMVVRVLKRHGEWVDSGDTVVKVVRVDRLRAEGFLHAKDVPNDLVGRPVVVETMLSSELRRQATGKIVFVSPEADPVNSQVRFWAEVDNGKGLLRPGLRGDLKILAPATDIDERQAEAKVDSAPVATKAE